MLEAEFKLDEAGKILKDVGGCKIVTTGKVSVEVGYGPSVFVKLSRKCHVHAPDGLVVGENKHSVATSILHKDLVPLFLRDHIRTVEDHGTSSAGTSALVYSLFFVVLERDSVFREKTAEAFPRWVGNLKNIWKREGPWVEVTLDTDGIWRKMRVQPMCEEGVWTEKTHDFSVEELERVREACVETARFVEKMIEKKR